MSKNDYANSRYSRFVAIPTIGEKGLKKIRKAKVTIVGTGGLGSVTATQLTSLGVKFLRIIDNDTVDITNLQRQTLYREKDIGKPKVHTAKKFLQELNPDIEIEAIKDTINSSNVNLAIDDVDFVVDAVDRFAPRFALNEACLEKDIPFIFGAVSGLSGNTMTVRRKSACIDCIFHQADDEKLPTSIEVGIHPAIISIIGSIQVSEATRIMMGEEPLLLNKLQFCDIGSMEFETLTIKPRASCSCSKFF